MVCPLPKIEDFIEMLKGKKYFSIIDLLSGLYWQCPVTELRKQLCWQLC